MLAPLATIAALIAVFAGTAVYSATAQAHSYAVSSDIRNIVEYEGALAESGIGFTTDISTIPTSATAHHVVVLSDEAGYVLISRADDGALFITTSEQSLSLGKRTVAITDTELAALVIPASSVSDALNAFIAENAAAGINDSPLDQALATINNFEKSLGIERFSTITQGETTS